MKYTREVSCLEVTEHCLLWVGKGHHTRTYFIIDVVITLERQELAFRGHHEDSNKYLQETNNCGNFYEFLQLKSKR